MSQHKRMGAVDRQSRVRGAGIVVAVVLLAFVALISRGRALSAAPVSPVQPLAPFASDAAVAFLPIALDRGEPLDVHAQPSPTATTFVGPSATPSATSVVAPSATPPAAASAVPSATPGATAAAPFAPYVSVPVDVVPDAPDYTPDLARVTNPWLVNGLTGNQREVLARNGFVVVPATHEQFYDLYTEGHSASIPAFVTADALLHTYHVLYDAALRDAEQVSLMGDLQALTSAMLRRAETDFGETDGAVRDAAFQNLAYFAVAARLLAPDAETPAAVRDVVAAELALIAGHAGVAASPIFGYDEDYSQYVPRGHYTRDAAFQHYFRAMMWYGRIGFRLDPRLDAEIRRRETRDALLMVRALHTVAVGQQTALDVWDRIYDVTAFFVGTADDLTVHDYAGLARTVYGDLPAPGDLADDAMLDVFIAAARKLRPPAILNTPIGPGEDKTAATMGFRFMGQRYIPDSAIFQQLIFDEVKGGYRGSGTPFTVSDGVRSFPRGLDVPAALGSARALDILTAAGDTDYDGYDTQLAAVRNEFASLEPGRWTSNLYWSWLNSLTPLLDVAGAGFPFFMRNGAWVDKSLNAWLGSWSQLRHDTILYAKPSMPAPTGMPGNPDGYVEPNPWLYARLAALCAQMRTGLSGRGLLRDDMAWRLDRMETLLLALKTIAERELVGDDLSDAQYTLIRDIGADLQRLAEIEAGASVADLQIAVVADVHSVPLAGLALEEGVGDAFEIYVVLPQPRGQAGEQVVMRGGVFSYYEFKWPISDRLTDEKWQAMDPKPALPEWTSSYVVAP